MLLKLRAIRTAHLASAQEHDSQKRGEGSEGVSESKPHETHRSLFERQKASIYKVDVCICRHRRLVCPGSVCLLNNASRWHRNVPGAGEKLHLIA